MIYFDNAATSFPKPKRVLDSIYDCMNSYCANPSRGSHTMAIQGDAKILECRNRIGQLFNIGDSFNICFTKNATEGINLAVANLIGEGDHVITTTLEHNSVLRPLALKEKVGVEVTYLSTGDMGYVNLNELESAIKENTKIIIINHASNVLGTVQDIKNIGKIAREKDVIFMVDASQSAGVIDIDVERDNIDIMAMPGHKGLYGPQGTGILYISERVKIENKTLVGGTGSNSNSVIQPEFMPDKFESGTVNLPGIVGLNEGLKFLMDTGLKKIRKKEMDMLYYLYRFLKEIPKVRVYGDFEKRERSSVISFNIEGYDSSDVGEYFSEKKIYLRTGYHCAPLAHKEIGTEFMGTVRVSLGYFNTKQECEILARYIKKLLKEGL